MGEYDKAALWADLELEMNNTGTGALDAYTCSICGGVSTHEELPVCEKCGQSICSGCECDCDQENTPVKTE
jgi:hypothetical protein